MKIINMTEYLPSSTLSDFIQSYRFIESAEGNINYILPNASPTIAIRYRGQFAYRHTPLPQTLDPAIVTGITPTLRKIEHLPNTAALIITFKPFGILHFINIPLHELPAVTLSLENFFPASALMSIQEQLASAPSNKERVKIIEQFLVLYLKPKKWDPRIQEAVREINITHGNIRVRELIQKLYISQDAFEKKFRKYVGAAPKQYARIIRMRHTVQQLQQSPRNILDTALELGYYDQAHFTKDIKQLTSIAPGKISTGTKFW